MNRGVLLVHPFADKGLIMAKVIILGMNRTGTKLASFFVSKIFNLPNVYLEPFTWDKGIDASISDDWKPQQKERKRNPEARIEHNKVNIISTGDESSKWLERLLNDPGWDVIKLIEIGRHDLYYKHNENCFYVSLIRHPVAFLQSVKGMKEAREAILEQWDRLKNKEGYEDPLPDANDYLDNEIADCSRAYKVLYDSLNLFKPKYGMKVDYDDIVNQELDLKSLSKYLGGNNQPITELPRLGNSTKIDFPDNEISYIEEKLTPVYHSFLKNS